MKYAPKVSHTPPLIKQTLISTPPHIMIILSLPPPPPASHAGVFRGASFVGRDEKRAQKSPPIDSLIPSLLVGFLPSVQTSLQMKGHQNHRTLSLCHLRMNWEIRLIFYSISGTKVPACVGENSINQLSLAQFHLSSCLIELTQFNHTVCIYRTLI